MIGNKIKIRLSDGRRVDFAKATKEGAPKVFALLTVAYKEAAQTTRKK